MNDDLKVWTAPELKAQDASATEQNEGRGSDGRTIDNSASI